MQLTLPALPLPRPTAVRLLTPASLLLRKLPDSVHARAVSLLANFLMQGQSFASGLADLEGKRLALRFTDAGREVRFTVHNGRLAPSVAAGCDVRISGGLEDFLKLALREDDPDTLFFDRRLCLEGETEAGLYLKNLLDAAEFDFAAHLEAVLGPQAGTKMTALCRRLTKPKLHRRP